MLCRCCCWWCNIKQHTLCDSRFHAKSILSAPWYHKYLTYSCVNANSLACTMLSDLRMYAYSLAYILLILYFFCLHLIEFTFCPLRSDTTFGHTFWSHPHTKWSMMSSRGWLLRSPSATQWCPLSCCLWEHPSSFTGQQVRFNQG